MYDNNDNAIDNNKDEVIAKIAQLEQQISNLKFRNDRLSTSVRTYESQHESVKNLIIDEVKEGNLDKEVASSILAELDIEAERKVKVTMEVTVTATFDVGIFDEVDEDNVTLNIDGCTIDLDGDEQDADWEDTSTSVEDED